MEKDKIHELKQLVRQTQVIDGFSYPLLRLLLNKLIKLKDEDRIFVHGEQKAIEWEKEWPDSNCEITLPVKMVTATLGRNLDSDLSHLFNKTSPIRINRFIEIVEEFLLIFESD